MTELFDTRVSNQQYLDAFNETIYMVGISLFIGSLLGIPIAVLLVLTP